MFRRVRIGVLTQCRGPGWGGGWHGAGPGLLPTDVGYGDPCLIAGLEQIAGGY